MKRFVIPAITTLLLAIGSSTQAQSFANGDLEIAGDGTYLFDSWTNNAGVTLAAQPIGGANSARISQNSGGLGNALTQVVDPGLSLWNVSFDLAANSSARSMQLNLRSTVGSDSRNINLIVVAGSIAGMGTVRVHNGSAFVDAVPNAFTLSTAESGDGFAVNQISIFGNYSTAAPFYNVTVNGTTSSDFTTFQGGAPAQNSALSQVAFQSGNLNAAGWSVVDNVAVVPVPEPGTLGLFALGGLGLMGLIRFRKN